VPAIADHIGGEDLGELVFDGHWPPRTPRSPEILTNRGASGVESGGGRTHSSPDDDLTSVVILCRVRRDNRASRQACRNCTARCDCESGQEATCVFSFLANGSKVDQRTRNHDGGHARLRALVRDQLLFALR
jgi:hypothetical protein